MCCLWRKNHKGAGSKEKYKGEMKFPKKEQEAKRKREQEAWGKMLKGTEHRPPLTEPHDTSCLGVCVGYTFLLTHTQPHIVK